jgi:hypothetical protein
VLDADWAISSLACLFWCFLQRAASKPQKDAPLQVAKGAEAEAGDGAVAVACVFFPSFCLSFELDLTAG